jgi:hypothetical protein
MIETIISGLSIAAFSGLTFLAYKHHEGYKVIIKPILITVWVMFIWATGFFMGFTHHKYSDNAEMPFPYYWIGIGLILFYLYLLVLDNLPNLTNKK